MREPLTISSDDLADVTPPPDPPRVAKPGHVLHRYVTSRGWLVEVEAREHSPEDHRIRREMEGVAAYRVRRAEIHAAIEAREDSQ